MGDVGRPGGRIGERFMRSLTEAEIDTVRDARRRSGRTALARAASAFVALWDVILLEAEGCTYEEAADRGLKLDVRAYAIPERQAEELGAILCGRLGSRDRGAVLMTWFAIGPSITPEPGTEPDTRQTPPKR